MSEAKNKITSGELQKWLHDNGVKLSRLAKLMGTPQNMLTHRFNHTGAKGRAPRRFTPEMTARLNAALPLLAAELRSLRIEYKKEDGKLGRGGNVYYPQTMDAIRALRSTLQIKPFVKKALGWNDTRYNSVLVSKVNAAYSNITASYITGINTALEQIAVALEKYELIPDVTDSLSSE